MFAFRRFAFTRSVNDAIPSGEVSTAFRVSFVSPTASESADTRIAPTDAGTEARPLKHLKHETPIFRDRRNRRMSGGPTMVRLTRVSH
jgi:hypothetical protein